VQEKTVCEKAENDIFHTSNKKGEGVSAFPLQP